jgi:hypothetical protein
MPQLLLNSSLINNTVTRQTYHCHIVLRAIPIPYPVTLFVTFDVFCHFLLVIPPLVIVSS